MANASDALSMWTVYDHPSDFPNGFIAREWITSGSEPQPTDVVIVAPLETIRKNLQRMGLVCLTRAPDDDPAIVETWL